MIKSVKFAKKRYISEEHIKFLTGYATHMKHSMGAGDSTVLEITIQIHNPNSQQMHMLTNYDYPYQLYLVPVAKLEKD